MGKFFMVYSMGDLERFFVMCFCLLREDDDLGIRNVFSKVLYLLTKWLRYLL